MRLVVLVLVFLWAASPTPSAAAVSDSVLVISSGYILGGPLPQGLWSFQYGDRYELVGVIQRVNLPIALPPEPAEYTVYVDDAVCTGLFLWDDPQRDIGGMAFTISASILEVFRDMSPDADPALPESYRDGELVLYGNLGELTFYLDGPSQGRGPGLSVSTGLRFAGGSWFYCVSEDGVGYGGRAVTTSDFYWDPDIFVRRGIIGSFEAAISIDFPTAVRMTTWGRLKSLYE